MADYQRENYNAADIDACAMILREILWENHGKGLRLAQVIGNLGDNYNMEDPEFLQYLNQSLLAQSGDRVKRESAKKARTL